MIKKFAVLLPLAVAVLGSSAAMAANDASTTINIKADIPTKQFHAQPLDPNFGRDEIMTYNTVTGELSTLSSMFTLKNTGGSIDAYLQDGPAALMGVRPGDVITHLNNQAIDTSKTFAAIAKALPKDRSVSMRVLRGGRASFITFKLAE